MIDFKIVSMLNKHKFSSFFVAKYWVGLAIKIVDIFKDIFSELNYFLNNYSLTLCDQLRDSFRLCY